MNIIWLPSSNPEDDTLPHRTGVGFASQQNRPPNDRFGSKAASSLRAACQLPPAADMPISSRHQQPRHLNSKPFTARAAGMPRAPPGLFVHEPEQVSLTPIWLRRRALLRTSTKEYRYREWRSGRETLVVARILPPRR